jgi:hypothetical protein
MSSLKESHIRLFLIALLALTLACPAWGSSSSHLRKRELRQVRSLHRSLGTLRFFRSHPRQARSPVGRREVRRARIWVAVIRRELAETRAALRPGYSVPGWFTQAALCLHSHEGAWNSNTGNGYYGGLQYLLSTWASVGGVTRPDLASPREQIYRAFLVWSRDGGSFREWGTAGMCRLR